MSILQVNNLSVAYKVHGGIVKAVDKISFSLNKGEILGIVGESGSGKSQTAHAIMGLLANNAMVSGSIKFMQQELLGLDPRRFNKLRGNKIAIIFQDPMTALNPYLPIQVQMIEVLMLHQGLSKNDAITKSVQMLDFVKIPEAQKRIKLYPHEFSGGMRQRVMIAMALLCNPEVVIADEPTTALDVTIQAQILELIRNLQTEFKTAVLMITHDMGVVASICNRVNVMYAGQIMESATVDEIFYNTRHPYTQALLKSIPSMKVEVSSLTTIPGEPPNLFNLPRGCVFQERCSFVHDECRLENITEQILNDTHIVKCNLNMSNDKLD